MNKVISINLNGNACQMEEEGYQALDAYLKKAREHLAGNPDLEEILTDIEQAIADKCNRFIRAGKTVVLSAEVKQIIEEMGPVSSGEDHAGEPEAETDASGEWRESKTRQTGQGASARRPRKLYRLKEDKMVEGICSGIAAYLGVDPTIVRIIFVALLIITGGTIAIAYLVMIPIIPEAKTPEEHAAAHGDPFDAQEVIERARSKFQDFQSKAERAQHQKKSAEYWKHPDREKVNSGLSAVLTVLLCIIGAGVILKLLNWPLSPGFLHIMGPYTFHPWLSVLVLFILIFVLGRLIKNLSMPESGAGKFAAGLLKICLVVLVVLFAIRMFPIMFWLIMEIVSFFKHTFPAFPWW
jgi:phage shock protein PspC (stress-responsive transcriptional regulator)